MGEANCEIHRCRNTCEITNADEHIACTDTHCVEKTEFWQCRKTCAEAVPACLDGCGSECDADCRSACNNTYNVCKNGC
jgi:hypothetical protein